MAMASSLLDFRTVDHSRNISHVLTGALGLTAVGSHEEFKQSQKIARMWRTELGSDFSFSSSSPVIVLCVDGLGFHNLQARSGHARFLTKMTGISGYTSVTPSTTAAALTALGTGCEPGKTSMAGYQMRDGKLARNFSLITFTCTRHVKPGVQAKITKERSKIPSSISPAHWQTCPTIGERIAHVKKERLGLPHRNMAVVMDSEYRDSGLTCAAWRGTDFYPASTPDEQKETVVRLCESGYPLIYTYWREVDHTGHHYGWDTPEWEEALEVCDSWIEKLMRELSQRCPGTLLIVCADHGMIDARTHLDLAPFFRSEKSHPCELVSGEERAAQLYTTHPSGMRDEEREERDSAWAKKLQEYCGEAAWVITKGECRKRALMGEMTNVTYSRVGDILLFARSDYAIIDSSDPYAGRQNGLHGSLSAMEMEIPLLFAYA